MDRGSIVGREGDQDWEDWSEGYAPQKGMVYWKTLISKGVTRSENLTLGVMELPPGEALREHQHRQEEIYLVLEGSGVLRVGAEEFAVEAGTAVFVPGDALHSCQNTGVSDLRVACVFPADSFDEVEYVFEV